MWDGRLWLAGLNPFDHLPTWYMEEGHEVAGLDAALFASLNSPTYYTIYPPVAQGVFTFATWIAPGSVTGAAWVMKGILLLADVAAVFFLYRLLLHWKQPVANVLWYALNPLCIIECVGNLHFEGLMVACLLAALYALVRGYYFGAAVAFALSIATKLLPLLFLPFCIRRMGIAKSFVWLGWIGIISVALWWPIVSGAFLENFTQSIALYVRQFEFNASFYYVIREIGYSWKGYNIIRLVEPWLWGTVTIIIFLRALLERSRRWEDIPEVWLFAISTFLFFATTVHPWYALLPLVLSTLTPWRWTRSLDGAHPAFLSHVCPSFFSRKLRVDGSRIWSRTIIWWVGMAATKVEKNSGSLTNLVVVLG
ncbi:MAG: glycosyltransferase 87 family protein [Saprospiraceae bacterium]